MKYFVYNFLWKNKGYGFDNSGTGIFAGKSIIDLYYHNISQPEEWVLTHVAEITKEEYDRAEEDGVIG